MEASGLRRLFSSNVSSHLALRLAVDGAPLRCVAVELPAKANRNLVWRTPSLFFSASAPAARVSALR